MSRVQVPLLTPSFYIDRPIVNALLLAQELNGCPLTRFISPPLADLEDSPLKQVATALSRSLHDKWEIFICPYLNGERPDLLLLNEDYGVVIVEVIDLKEEEVLSALCQYPRFNLIRAMQSGSLGSRDYTAFASIAKEHGFWRSRDIDAARKVLLDDNLRANISPEGKKVILDCYRKIKSNSPTWVDALQRATFKLSHIQTSMRDLYCPRLGTHSNLSNIPCLLVFSNCSNSFIQDTFKNFWDSIVKSRIKGPHVTFGLDALSDKGAIQTTLFGRYESTPLDPELTKDLRNWLVEPYFSEEERKPIKLDSRQYELVYKPSESRYRRIRGPAGSGKSLVMASRAARLASEGGHGQNILVVVYNITLIEYLRRISLRFTKFNLLKSVNNPIQVSFVNFHHLCKMLAIDLGITDDYRNLWKGLKKLSTKERKIRESQILDHELPDMISKALSKYPPSKHFMFSAIFVDEAQDFLPKWWNLLRTLLSENGEITLSADYTQDLYERAEDWTKEKMTGYGFSTPWINLKSSYRLPEEIVLLADLFAKRFLSLKGRQSPEYPQSALFSECQIQLRQTLKENFVEACAAEAMRLVTRSKDELFAITDVTILVTVQSLGIEIENLLHEKYKVATISTFVDDSQSDRDRQRSKKMSFSMQTAKIKLTTIHSFKGWESRAIVLATDRFYTESDKVLFYTGLTRVVLHPSGSFLSIIASPVEIEPVFREFKRKLNETRADVIK